MLSGCCKCSTYVSYSCQRQIFIDDICYVLLFQTSDDEDIDKVYTWPTSKIAPYIAQLPLPPDYCLRELRELVPNFASEISEQ